MTDRPTAFDLPGIYVHIPFCIQKCGYCGFTSITDRTLLPDFLTALHEETAGYRAKGETFDTLYIGGGTPSVLNAADLDRLIDDIRSTFTITPGAEITVEINPGDIQEVLLRGLSRMGVNRLNIGIQSLDDAALAFLGRRHTARQAAESLRLARKAGFANIGIDLIYGIPGQSMSRWQEILGEALSLRPDHISCYQLTAEAGTPLADRCRKGEVILPGDTIQADYFLRTSHTLEESGYVHYEVSNFARVPETESRHNKKYWRHTPYLGLGPAAHSFDGSKRWWNISSVAAYIREIAAGRSPVSESEVLTVEQMRLETLFLGFRTGRGVHLADYQSSFGKDLIREKGRILKRLRREGLVEIRDGFLRPTRTGMAVADSLALI
jgi:oxygen-independent coproporphyrinogen III oxidase